MPYPNDDSYISLEEQIRRQYEAQLSTAGQQPYAQDEMMMAESNLQNVQTQLAQQMGRADYAELLRRGTSMQRSGTTQHYSSQFGLEKGYNPAEGLPTRDNYLPPNAWSPSPVKDNLIANLGGQLLGMGVKYGAGKIASRGQEVEKLTSTDWESRGILDPQFQNFTAMTPAGAIAPHLAKFYNIGSGGQPFMNTAGITETLRNAGYTDAMIAEHFKQVAPNSPAAGGEGLEQGVGTKGAGTVGSMAAGAAVGTLTGMMLEELGVHPVMASTGGSMAGGATAAAVGGASAAGGAITGGVGGVAAMVAMNLWNKYVNEPKYNRRDDEAMKLAEQTQSLYKGKTSEGLSQRMGIQGGTEAILSAPYMWMTKEGRDFREAAALDPSIMPQMPDKPTEEMYQAKLAELKKQGVSQPEMHARQAIEREYKAGAFEANKYKAPEYRPSQYEAWVGAMLDNGVSMRDIRDATAYYISDTGHDEITTRSEKYSKGQDYWLSQKSDVERLNRPELNQYVKSGGAPSREAYLTGEAMKYEYTRRPAQEAYDKALKESQYGQDLAKYEEQMAKYKAGEDLFSADERKAYWEELDTKYKVEPWQTDAFKEAYQKEYGWMPEAPKAGQRASTAPKGMEDPRKHQNWYLNHYGTTEEYVTGGEGGTGSKRIHGQKYYDDLNLYLGTTNYAKDQVGTDYMNRQKAQKSGVISTSAYESRDLYGSDFGYQEEESV